MTADEWNERYPNGARVRFRPVDGVVTSIETTTRTRAWALGHGEAIVAVHGRAGGVGVEFLEVLEAIPVGATKELES